MFHRPLRRPLAIVLLLSLGDYLLWNWSLSGSHDVLGLIAGLTLTPLLIALFWLLFLGTTRFIADTTRSARVRSDARARALQRRASAQPLPGEVRYAAGHQSARSRRTVTDTGAGEASSPVSPSSKLAA